MKSCKNATFMFVAISLFAVVNTIGGASNILSTQGSLANANNNCNYAINAGTTSAVNYYCVEACPILNSAVLSRTGANICTQCPTGTVVNGVTLPKAPFNTTTGWCGKTMTGPCSNATACTP